jgi:flagellar M-ring protein FliF
MNEQVQALLKQVSVTQRIGIIGAALAAVAMIGILVMFASKPDYTPAFTGLSASDATAVEGALRAANISYQVADAGTTIEVPVDSLGDAKIAAGNAGVASGANSDTQGWSLFDNQGFGQSEFDQNVTYQRAIEGELTQTIQGMQGVASARVSVVLAQTGALSSQDTPASAAVVLTMTGGATPSSGLVQAIVNTVAKSVQGLSTDNVVVTDDRGQTLAGSTSSVDSTAAQAKDLIEQQTESKIASLLDAALGAGHASVAVSADVDTSQIEQDVTTYAPAGSDPPVSIHQIIETYNATSSTGACGIPGTDSNVAGLPSYPGLCPASTTAAPTTAPSASPSASASAAASAGASAAPTASAGASATPAAGASAEAGNYLHEETTVNYSVSQTVQHIVTQPGVVKKLSVAVFVDQKSMGSLTADTLKTSIAAAIGADDSRGDVVAVQAVTFAAQPTAGANAANAAAAPDVAKTVGGASGTILGGVFALVMLVLFWMNLGALRRKADEQVYDLGPTGSTPAFVPVPNRAGIPASTAPDAPPAADAPNATPQARIQERLRMVADERPDALVGLMHGWLREEGSRR